MRITNNMLTSNYSKNLNDNLTALTKYQSQLSSFNRITKLSDDPIGSMKSMKINATIYKTTQYKSVVSSAKTILKDTESALTDMNELISNAYVKATQASNSYLTPDEKTAIASYIGQLRDHAVTLANSKSGDQYIFGGYNTQQRPFSVDSNGKILYNGLDLSDAANPDLVAENGQALTYEIGFGLTAEVTMPGTKLMSTGEDNLYNVLDGFYNALMSDAGADELSVYVDKLQVAQGQILSLEAEVGGKTNRMDLINNRYADDLLNYKEVKSNIEDVDVAETTLQYQMSQAVYDAALAIGSNIIMPTLVDYLK